MKIKPRSNKADGIRMTLIDSFFLAGFLFFMSLDEISYVFVKITLI